MTPDADHRGIKDFAAAPDSKGEGGEDKDDDQQATEDRNALLPFGGNRAASIRWNDIKVGLIGAIRQQVHDVRFTHRILR